jgi:cardiolipin hydrolase
MKPQEIREILKQTLDDRRFSRAECTALDAVLRDIEPNDRVRAVYRSMAFDLAEAAVDTPTAKQVVRWLEDVMRLLETDREAGQHTDVAESHFSPSEACPRRIASFVRGVRRTVDICVFTITDDRIASAIIDTHRNGRRVRVITDLNKTTDLRSDCEKLANVGSDVRAADRAAAHMHHKFAIADESLLLTGSYNWTRGAADYNEDNFLITGDRRFVRAYVQHFQKLWRELA